jgi:hypothetical protein
MKKYKHRSRIRTAYDVNKEMKKAAESSDTITLKNVLGQRFIGSA